MKRFYMINYLLCGICLLWMTGCSNMLDEMRPKDKIPQDALSESDLTKLLNGVYAEMEELVFKFYMDGDVKGENFKAGPGFSMIRCRWLRAPKRYWGSGRNVSQP